VNQFIVETRQILHQLLRTLNLKENTLVQLQLICDFSYAWEIIDKFTFAVFFIQVVTKQPTIYSFTELMQKGIRQNPAVPIKLRATFLKVNRTLRSLFLLHQKFDMIHQLSSAMDMPLMRIQQSGSPDLVSVSQFYSRNLVAYFRRVLQIIPESVFGLLAKIVAIRTNSVKDLPTRLDKDKMRDFAKLDDRYEVVKFACVVKSFENHIFPELLKLNII